MIRGDLRKALYAEKHRTAFSFSTEVATMSLPENLLEIADVKWNFLGRTSDETAVADSLWIPNW